MIEMTLAKAAMTLNSMLLAPLNETWRDISFTGLSINTKTLNPGNLFIALAGTKQDGHDFINDAFEKGAAAVLVTKPIPASIPHLFVNNAELALGQLAKAWRDQFSIPFIAITGSNGKTTLKNMVASILTAACGHDSNAVLATQGTLNNHLGLPLTLAQLNIAHRYAVIEMGMNHFGEIEYLTKLTRPHIAIITNAASAHLEGVGSIAGVAQAKSEIFLGLTEDGTVILNHDDAYFEYWYKKSRPLKCHSFGLNPGADVSATIPIQENNSNQASSVLLHTPAGEISLQLPLLGKHNILNTLAATAATLALGVKSEAIRAGLENIAPAPGRLQLKRIAQGINIIDDTYNANPFSLEVAINTLVEFVGPKILVLGDMKELGQEAANIHQDAGLNIRKAGIDYLFTYGELSVAASKAFGEGAYHFNEQKKLIDALKPFLRNQITILVKGSRSMRMEHIISGLIS